jgi:uncharacterized protein (UPF0210 family)
MLAILLSLPIGHLVQLEPLQIEKWDLPVSLDSTYKVYSFAEVMELKADQEQLSFLTKQTSLLDFKLKEDEILIASIKAELSSVKEINSIVVKEADRRLKSLEKCAVELKDAEDSTFPIIALSVGGTALVTGVLMMVLSH